MNRAYRWLLAALALVAIGTSTADADTRTGVLQWKAHSFANSCLKAGLHQEGQANFDVNQVPIPTYTRSGPTEYQDGSRDAVHEAPFSTSLLRTGSNSFSFHFDHPNGEDHCTHVTAVVDLIGLVAAPLRLFAVEVIGASYSGETDVSVSLEQIDPELARRIAIAREELLRTIQELRRLGPEADAAGPQIARYETLLAEIDALLEEGFDHIDLAELNDLLSRYSDIAPDLYRQLQTVVNDLRRDVEDLRQEMRRIADEFARHADALPDLTSTTGHLGDGEFQAGDYGSLPSVEVPDILGDDGYSEAHDPYDAYATDVIAQLRAHLDEESHEIRDRAAFLTVYGAWRANMRALDAALRHRAVVTHAEWGAFLDSQSRVVTFLRDYMTGDGWTLDSGIPADVRELVDVALRRVDATRSDRLKAALNLQQHLGESEQMAVFSFAFALREMSLATEKARELRIARELAQRRDTMWDSAISLLEKAAELGWDAAVALTPLGDVIDVCEAVTGKDGCNLISGRDLSWKERAFAATGILIWGSSHAIRKFAQKVEKLCALPLGLHLLARRASCDADRFFRYVDDVLERGGNRRPRKDVIDEIPNVDGSITYVRRDGLDVTFERGYPAFERRHMHPTAPEPEVWVEFFCNDTDEFRQANARNGFGGSTAPRDYTWHHSHRFERRDGKIMILMQLLKKEVHDWAAHAGGSSIGREILGVPPCRDRSR